MKSRKQGLITKNAWQYFLNFKLALNSSALVIPFLNSSKQLF